MDNTTCSCRNPPCPLSGRLAPDARLQLRGGHRHAARLRCQVCPAWVSARTGTASAGIPTDATTSFRGATAWAEGLRLRATGRLLRVDQDTGNPWLPVLGVHGQPLLRSCLRPLPVREGQLAELWTCMAKQEARLTALAQLAAIAGDAWLWIACSPVHNLVLAGGVGPRTLCAARHLVAQLTAAPDGPLPVLT